MMKCSSIQRHLVSTGLSHQNFIYITGGYGQLCDEWLWQYQLLSLEKDYAFTSQNVKAFVFHFRIPLFIKFSFCHFYNSWYFEILGSPSTVIFPINHEILIRIQPDGFFLKHCAFQRYNFAYLDRGLIW